MASGTQATAARQPVDLVALGAIAVTVVLWASAFVAIRHVGRALTPGSLVFGRLLVGSAVLGVLVLSKRPPWPARQHWPRLLICGLLWFGVYNLALNAAERRVDAGTAAMLVNVGPILIAVFAGVLLGEGFPGRLLSGSAVAFTGVVVIGLSTQARSGADTWGVVLCLVAAVSYAAGVVSQKPLLRSLSALQVTWLACLVGTVACLPFAPGLVIEAGHASAATLGWVLYLGVFPTSIAFTTWAYALARNSAGRLGSTTYLVPPLAIGISWLLLGEAPPMLAVAGGLLCITGVYLSRRRPRTSVTGGVR